MITLSIDASVLIALKKAMPKTNKAELALEKYKEVLKQLIEHSLMNMDDNLFRFPLDLIICNVTLVLPFSVLDD